MIILKIKKCEYGGNSYQSTVTHWPNKVRDLREEIKGETEENVTRNNRCDNEQSNKWSDKFVRIDLWV